MRWLAEHLLSDEAVERAFRAGWEASGEGWNGEHPDEGVKWEESAGYGEYHRWMRGER